MVQGGFLGDKSNSSNFNYKRGEKVKRVDKSGEDKNFVFSYIILRLEWLEPMYTLRRIY